MSYTNNPSQLTTGQRREALANAKSGLLNKGSNSEWAIMSTNNWIYNTSSNQQPLDLMLNKNKRYH